MTARRGQSDVSPREGEAERQFEGCRRSIAGRTPGHDMGEIDRRPCQADRSQHGIQQAARCAGKDLAVALVIGFGRPADHHQRGSRWAGRKDHPCGRCEAQTRQRLEASAQRREVGGGRRAGFRLSNQRLRGGRCGLRAVSGRLRRRTGDGGTWPRRIWNRRLCRNKTVVRHLVDSGIDAHRRIPAQEAFQRQIRVVRWKAFHITGFRSRSP